MGIKMEESASQEPPGSQDNDILLPDASPALNDKQTTNPAIPLDNIFDEDESDPEFPTSNAVLTLSSSSTPYSSQPTHEQPLPSSPPTAAVATSHTESYSDPALMLQFYSRLFPFRPLFQWLNHSPKPGPDFAHREFALTLQNDAYLRYQSYPTADLLRKDILKMNPSRFEIGPVYTTNPRDRKTLRKSSVFRPLSKEIVFDIDLTDYDDIRTCCVKANICAKCWTFATMAIKVIDVALRDDFGFDHIMWVYSGRRGVHAWISDKDARELDDDKRKAITGYFEVLKGGTQGGKKVNLKRPLHPHITRSLAILKPYFQNSILVDQDPFLPQAGQDRLLHLLPDKALTDALRKKWTSSPDRSSVRKWADIDTVAASGISKSLDTKALMEAKQDILLEYTYPRLDVEVGKKRIHLLKSPFVVHPGTGRICVPICTDGDMDRVEGFDPLTVPKVTELLKEVDSFGLSSDLDGINLQSQPNSFSQKNVVASSPAIKAEKSEYVEDGATMRRIADWEKTRLKPYIEMFETYTKKIMKAEMVRVKREREEEGEGMEF